MLHRPTLVWAALVGALLLFPRLGAFGLWDPPEIKLADAARGLDASSGRPATAASTARATTRPPLQLALQSLGYRYLGVNEAAGRVPLAICGWLCVLLTGLLAGRLFGASAGAWSALALVTSPGFLFQARQLPSDVLLCTASVAAWGGLAIALLDSPGSTGAGAGAATPPSPSVTTRWRIAGASLGIFGIIIGTLARGVLLGAVLPLLACVAAFPPRLVRLKHDNQPLLAAVRWLVAALALVLTLGVFWSARNESGAYSIWIGSAVRVLPSPATFDSIFKQIAYAVFPWTGVLVIGLLGVLAYPAGLVGSANSTRAARRLLAGAITAGVVLALVFAWIAQTGTTLAFPTLPALAIAIGVAMADISRELRRAPNDANAAESAPSSLVPLAGVVAACAAIIVGRDLFLSHGMILPPALAEGVKLPEDLRAGGIRPETVHLIAGVAAGVAGFLLWVGLPAVSPSWLARPRLAAVARLSRRAALVALPALAIFHAAFTAHVLVPELSRHLSSRDVLRDFARLRKPGDKLARYRVSGRGADYYAESDIVEVRTQQQLIELLGSPERVWILLGATELAAIDQAARKAERAYYVLDDTSSRTLLISNQLQKNERDRNPLRMFVSTTPPQPKTAVHASFEGKVELVGHDIPPTIDRGKKLPITLHFHVIDKLPANYKIFVHFDQPAYRFHGDHDPLGGKLATQYWSPGTYVTDRYEIDIPRITTPSGTYEVLMGFWQGGQDGKRFEVTEGPQDGSNRVKLGKLIVR